MGTQSKSFAIWQVVSIAGLMVALGTGDLVWLGREDRIWRLLASMIGPVVGLSIGLYWLGDREKPPNRHAWPWHATMGFVFFALWLVLVDVLYGGGVSSDAIIPTVVLSIAGTSAYVLVVPFLWPDTFTSRNKRTIRSHGEDKKPS